MMKMIYMGILFLMIVLVMACTGVVRRKNDETSRSIFRLFLVAIASTISNGIFVMVDIMPVANFFHSVFLSSIDWLLMLMLNFVMCFTEYNRKYKKLIYVGYAVATIEMISMLLNPFYGHVFKLEQCYSKTFGNYFKPVEYTNVFLVHLAFSYLLVLAIFAFLVAKFVNTPKVYRKKYGAIIVCVTVVVLFDAVGLAMNFPIDISLIFYCAACLGVFFFASYYVPKTISETIMRTAVRMVDMGVGFFDIYGKCVYVNKRGEQMISKFKGLAVSDDYEILERYFAGWLQRHWTDKDQEQTYVERFSDIYRNYTYEFTVQKLVSEEKEFLGYFITCIDRTVEFEQYEEEHYRATHDLLTGIYNLQYFEQKVSETIKRNPFRQFVMITSDIKDFKLMNDLFGTDRGDEVLKMHAELFRKYAGEDVVYGRLVEDRFGFFMPKERFSNEQFLEAMNQLTSHFTNEFFKLQIYMGVYESVDKNEPIFVMIDKCNLAISTIRGSYSKRIAMYDESLFRKEMDKNAIINEFDGALSMGEFEIYLQPQITRDGKMIGAEALARWNHPDKGMIPPARFIPILEQAGLIYRLDANIWEMAAKQLAEWKQKGREDLHISVNISAQDQYHIDIFETMKGLVEKYEINPRNLKLEITESIFITEVDKHLELVKRLQAYGFEIEIDDFGSGYSSLNILKDISANVIKIDMGFLQDTGNRARSEQIVASIIALAKKLDIFVITEGVETKEQVEKLTAMNCDAFQGFYYSKPIPVKEFEERYMKA